MAEVLATFTCRGLGALLMNNPASMERPQTGGGRLGQKRIPTPEEEAKPKLYLLANGALCMPSIAFRECLLGACCGRRIGKTGAVKVVSGAVFCIDDKTPLLDLKTEKAKKDWTIDTRRAVVQKSGVQRSRPCVADWMARVTFQITDTDVTVAQVRELLSIGGRTVGIGDYRPAKRGWFGRFTVDEDVKIATV